MSINWSLSFAEPERGSVSQIEGGDGCDAWRTRLLGFRALAGWSEQGLAGRIAAVEQDGQHEPVMDLTQVEQRRPYQAAAAAVVEDTDFRPPCGLDRVGFRLRFFGCLGRPSPALIRRLSQSAISHAPSWLHAGECQPHVSAKMRRTRLKLARSGEPAAVSVQDGSAAPWMGRYSGPSWRVGFVALTRSDVRATGRKAAYRRPIPLRHGVAYSLLVRAMFQSRSRQPAYRRGSMIWADVHRCVGSSGYAATLRLFLTNRTFRPIVTLRLYQSLSPDTLGAGLARVLLAFLHRRFCSDATMDLPIQTSIGPGVEILHGWGLVVNGRAVLGKNVTLFHGVTIGQGDRISADGSRRTGYPVIEDDVWIGPNAAIVGDITIGAGSRIMPGAVVSTSVPPKSMVAGNPSTIIRENCTMDVLNRVESGL